MKSKFLIAMTLVAISLSFIGCTANKNTAVETLPEDDIFSEVYSYIDPETGVNYLIYSNYQAGGITVRLNADGTPYVTPVDKTNEE